MKVKLFFVQEIYNADDPRDCVGPLHIFNNEKDRDWFFVDHFENEYCSYQRFEKEISI